MPTKRVRLGRGNVVPKNILLMLGLGTAMNSYRLEELKRLWREYGAAVRDYWQAKFGKEPFASSIARKEKWK